ncbi:hypothetical protein LI168_03250 [Desulfovibrio desulfuricans]|uniref:hypothetical protein n=1 Tax=Desulfovibrio desulfuricans TaxID=876 RepID=UPI001D082AF1|nr:hypothetical protein [Desulfovibrio desulfuricans]MCB6541153.1 hypothetical protein [Desulfovibrio desulfuricans]MCB6552235.1 hypothetical protein [Desulfovibrio desulfuricans]MCB6564078.1 hypothetical protein [Desulfovibrio desulfuricans]MCB7345258.1 hypothetical protein [Desulfovibrio desulfuricans]MCQ5217289.1 hypothetical protein [Desulfovibrio desulfuricans]
MGELAARTLFSNDTGPLAGTGLDTLAKNQGAILELEGAQAPQSKTIVSGSISPTAAYVIVDTEGSAAADDLDVISPVLSASENLHDGMVVHLKATDSGRVVKVKNSTSANGINTYDGNDYVLSTTHWLKLQLRSGKWYEVEGRAMKTALAAATSAAAASTPATTTSRGIGRVATAADAAVGSTITNGPAFLDAATWKISATSAGGTIPLADANGKLDAWVNPQTQYATCETAAATAGKEATLTGFSLVKGARVFVTFSKANTVAGALTLNVNSTGAKAIYNEFGAVSSNNPMKISAGIATEFIYDGTNWTYQDAGGAYDYIGSAFRNLQAGSSINGSVVGSGVGSFCSLYANNSTEFTLPAGGTWFVFYFGTNGNGNVEWASGRSYVMAGGSVVPVVSWASNGFAIRIK